MPLSSVNLGNPSIVVQKRFAVDQRPQQILRARRAPGAALHILEPAFELGRVRRAAERREIEFGNQVAVPLNSAKEDSRGAIKATIPLPVEYIAFLQSHAVDSVAVTKVTAAQLQGQAKKTVSLIKALKAGKKNAQIPSLTGQEVLKGPIVSLAICVEPEPV